MNIYKVFYSKLPTSEQELLPDGAPKFITFLNPYYIEKYPNTVEIYERFDYICSDGMFPILLNKIWGKAKSWRCSFDMGSLAAKVFTLVEKQGKSIYFLGTTEYKLKCFINIMLASFPKLKIAGSHHGYIKGEEDKIVKAITAINPDVVIIGMGAPLQDVISLKLKDAGFLGTVYTCGGFMHQSSERLNYYPNWVNRLNLRTFYRLIRERYVWGRVIKFYPKFIVKYSWFLLRLKK